MSKRDTLVEMLRRYRDAQETLTGSYVSTGDGAVPLMPPTWTASMRELERCLQVLSGERPKQARQLLARYVDPTVSRRRLRGKRVIDPKTGQKVLVFPDLPSHSEVRTVVKLAEAGRAVNEWDAVLASWPSWVRASLVEAALQRLESLFVGEPYVPSEMLVAA